MERQVVIYSDELYHHGIKGQRWGIRRFQNPDGTLTEEGKRRKNSDDYEEARALSKKKSSQLSNAELRKLNERYNLESQRENYERQRKRGAMWMDSFSNEFRKKSAKAVAAAVVAAGTIYLKNNYSRILEDIGWWFVK